MASTEYVTLVSNDGHSFVIKRSAASISPAIKRMLDPANGFSESKTNTCHFENIAGEVLEVVVEYFYYHEKYRESKDVPDMDFPLEVTLDVLLAADYLNGK